MNNNGSSFILYDDNESIFHLLNKDEIGDLMLAIFEYRKTGTEPNFENNRALNMAFYQIKIQLDNNKRKYDEKCKKNKEAITKRWQDKNTSDSTDVYERIQTYQDVSIDDVIKYCKEKQYNIDVNTFYSTFEKQNFKMYGKDITEWKKIVDQYSKIQRI